MEGRNRLTPDPDGGAAGSTVSMLQEAVELEGSFGSVVEFDFNNELAKETETLYFHSSTRGKKVAKIVQGQLLSALDNAAAEFAS